MSKVSIIFIFAVLIGIIGAAPAMATDDLLGPVDPIDRIYPADGQLIDESSEYNPNFSWQHMNGAEWYRVIIAKSGQIKFDQWYEASQVCQEGVCTSGNIWLAGTGEFNFWMTRWSPEIGSQFKYMYEKTTFTLDMPLPQPPAEGSGTPTGEINDTTPALTWENGSHAMWYQIWVGPKDLSGPIHYKWYRSDDVCSTEFNICGFTLENSVPQDDYIVFGRAWNPTGYSRWVVLNEFSVKFGLTFK